MIIKIHNHCQFEPSNSKSFEGFCKWCGKEQSEHYKTMSNNKQSMKLYTEEQILEFLENKIIFDSDDLNELTPIELPTDEEIDNEWKVGYSDYHDGCNWGAKWLRDEIGGDK